MAVNLDIRFEIESAQTFPIAANPLPVALRFPEPVATVGGLAYPMALEALGAFVPAFERGNSISIFSDFPYQSAADALRVAALICIDVAINPPTTST